MWCRAGLWEGRVPFLDCPSSVQAVFSLKLCGLSSPSEVLPLCGGTDSADHVNSLVSLNIITEDNPPGMRRRPQCWPCTPRLAELMEQVLAQQAPASSLVGRGVVCGCTGLRPGFVNQQAWELSCLLLDGGTRAGRGYMGFVAMVSLLTQGDTLR